MNQRPHIFLATPCFGGLVTQGYMQSVLQLMQAAPGSGFDLSLGLLGHDAMITRSRNTLLAQFLETATATHLLFVDADISFSPDQLPRMLAAERDIVAGMYPLKALHWDQLALARIAHESIETAAMLYVGDPCTGPDRREADGFVTARHAGTGFMLITRAAISRMIAAYPHTRYHSIHAYPLAQAPARTCHALFDGMIDPESGEYLSEDYTFCRRWRDVGGEIWLDTRGRLTHTGPGDFRGNPAPRFPPS